MIVSVALLAASPTFADDVADAAKTDAADADTTDAADAATTHTAGSATTDTADAVTTEAAGRSTLDAWAEGGAKAFDVIPIRLLSACAVIIGAGAFVVSVPLVGPGFQLEGIRSSWDYFVMGPYEYTFVRPLGDF